MITKEKNSKVVSTKNKQAKETVTPGRMASVLELVEFLLPSIKAKLVNYGTCSVATQDRLAKKLSHFVLGSFENPDVEVIIVIKNTTRLKDKAGITELDLEVKSKDSVLNLTIKLNQANVIESVSKVHENGRNANFAATAVMVPIRLKDLPNYHINERVSML